MGPTYTAPKKGAWKVLTSFGPRRSPQALGVSRSLHSFPLIVGLLLCVITALPLSAHATAPRAAAAPHVTILFEHQWIGVQEGYIKEVIRRFERLYPNITVKESLVADFTKIIAAIEGGKPPDVVDVGLGQYTPELASKGALT